MKIYSSVRCGGRPTLTTSGRKRVRKDGTLNRETRTRYQCHYNVRHPGECDGQSGYGVTKLDGIVSKIVRMQFERIRNEPPQDLIERQNAKEIDQGSGISDTGRQEYAQLVSWADMYDHFTFEAKKMILAQFIKAVYVRRDYEIEIEFNVSFEEFQDLYLAREEAAVIGE